MLGQQLGHHRERGREPVSLRPGRHRQWTRDAQFKVVVGDRHALDGIVRAVDTVGHVGGVGQGLDAMGEPAGAYSETWALLQSSKLSQFRYVGQVARRSTMTSKTVP